MAAKSGVIDRYANVAAVSIQEAVADTLAVTKFAFPFSIMDKMALLISRIEYFFNALGQLNSNGDTTYMALMAGSSVVDITQQNDPLIIDTMRYQRIDMGAAATGSLFSMPITRDFSTLPGGGLLVAPNPLYGAIKGLGEAGTTSGWMRLYYTYLELATDEYWQLVESRRIISS
jgi:hypothetical protein